MSRRKKPDAVPAGSSMPFFARYLEGQEDSEAAGSARVESRNDIAYRKAKGGPFQTLKFPSDSDELHYYPYYLSAAAVPKEAGAKPGVVTLKFPSDTDEQPWYCEYISAADVPKGNVKPKPAKVHLKKKK